MFKALDSIPVREEERREPEKGKRGEGRREKEGKSTLHPINMENMLLY